MAVKSFITLSHGEYMYTLNSCPMTVVYLVSKSSLLVLMKVRTMTNYCCIGGNPVASFCV